MISVQMVLSCLMITPDAFREQTIAGITLGLGSIFSSNALERGIELYRNRA